jgi:uncharacterized membrane protein YraQ (UPF0718 family)
VDSSFWILLGMTLAALAVAVSRDRNLPAQALAASGRLFGSVWTEIALGFLLAGLFDVLVSAETLTRWLGAERSGRGILVAWAAGLAIPGGPYLLFPVVARLFEKGVAVGPLITLVTAKTLVSPIRMLTYEAPLVGWPLTLSRFIPGLLVPPLLGLVGQWLYRIFSARPG